MTGVAVARDLENRVLVVAPTHRDGEITRELFDHAGIHSCICRNLSELTAEIDRGAGAILLTAEALMTNGVVPLLACLERQPSWSDLPIVILMQDGRQPGTLQELLRSLGNVTLLEKPAPARTVISAVTTAIRGRLRQYQIRDHMEESLRAAARERQLKEQLAIAIEASELGTFHCPLPIGKIEWNERCKLHFGLGPDDEVDIERFYALIHPADRDRTREAIEACIGRGEVYDIEYRVIHDEGSERWIRATGSSFCDTDGRPVRFDGTTEDITERKLAAERERELLDRVATANAKFQAFFEQGALFAGIMDIDGTIVEPNRLSLEACGFTREEVVGKLFWECPWWSRSPELMEQIKEASQQAAAGETFRAEMPYYVADGSERIVDIIILPIRDEAGNVVFLAPTGMDITDRKRVEAELRESQARFEAMANSIPQLAWMASADGEIFWFNQRWHEYCGTVGQGTDGWSWPGLVDPKELPRVLQTWQSALDTQQPWEDILPLRRHDGEYRWHLSRAMPFREESGEVQFWFGTNTDITEERNRSEIKQQLLEAEREARSEAERVSRLKDEFLATLSHELRTPLNAIFGWTQILKLDRRNGDTIEEAIDIIDRNVRLQTQLIDDLLDMSRIISGKVRLNVEAVDLPELIESAIESVKPTADAKGLSLESVIDTEAGPVTGDPGRLQQVLWNLLTNAIKFTPRGGKVFVTLESVDSHLEISVIDSGAGIKPEFLPHLFERFSQADASTTRKHGGLGLGLSIVKTLVELHGGTIEARSAGEGQGATFNIKLPRRATKSSLEPALSGSTPRRLSMFDAQERLHGVKVLVVDDEQDARELVNRFLVECGATAAIAKSAAEARLLLRDFHPDVIVSDIGMPDQDGYEFIRSVRACGVRTPAVALTAFARAEDRIRSIQAGYQTHLPKPVEPTELVAVVASLAGRY